MHTKLLSSYMYIADMTNGLVDLTQRTGEPRKNSKKANFGIIRKQIFHRITYPKSSKILLGKFLCPIVTNCTKINHVNT